MPLRSVAAGELIVRATKMEKTLSESLFEHYCQSKGIACRRIPQADTRTPDYELEIEGRRIVVEVKEIDRNKEERESDRLLRERGYGNVESSTPGDRVRSKIASSSAQIKARTVGVNPSILVLFDSGQAYRHLHPYKIRVAMYGLEQVYIALPPLVSGRHPTITGKGYGPKRKMTHEHNTSISAIGVLFTPGPDEISLHVYHNKFAEVALNAGLLCKYGIEQFELEDEIVGTTANWREVVSSKEP